MKKIKLELTLEEAYVLLNSLHKTCSWYYTRALSPRLSKYFCCTEEEKEEFKEIFYATDNLYDIVDHMIKIVEKESEQNA